MEIKQKNGKQVNSSLEKMSFNQKKEKMMDCSYTSKEDFLTEYKSLLCNEVKEFYILILYELEKTVSEGDVDKLKKLMRLLDYISEIENHSNLNYFFNNVDNPLKNTNLIILACRYNKVKVLEYLFHNCAKTFHNLSVVVGRNSVLPSDQDGRNLNAFYYAILSSNVELISLLIAKWSNIDSEELNNILSSAYEELKLKNLPLSAEMEYFVQSKLIDLRFISSTSVENKSIAHDLNKISERVELLLENIGLLNAEYSNKEVDGRFLYIMNFIVKNIHILKRQLKSSYSRLPWEEVEFCLICFITSQTKQQEINLICQFVLNKNSILSYLEDFAKKLGCEKDAIKYESISKLADLPRLKREEIVTVIIRDHPEFEKLYSSLKKIRDVYSLWKISDTIKLATSADPHEKEGQLVIMRSLQIVGELLKNTLESPKLSDATGELLLSLLPRNTRKIIINMRNSLSHAYSLAARTEIEGNASISFFVGVQTDIARVGEIITDILYNNKMKIVRLLLEKIINENVVGIKEAVKALSNVEINQSSFDNVSMISQKKLEKFLKELCDIIPDQTIYEKQLFHKINETLNSTKHKSERTTEDYIIGLQSLKTIKMFLSDWDIDHNSIRTIKYLAKHILENTASQTETCHLKKISLLLKKLLPSVILRINENNNEIYELFFRIFNIVELDTGSLKWIEELKERLNSKGLGIPIQNKQEYFAINKCKYNDYLILKQTELKNVLKKNKLTTDNYDTFSLSERNKKLLAAIEMLLLDIMSILDINNCFENNPFFLDENIPLLIGKCLRNYLAHSDAFYDTILCDSAAIVLNAIKLTDPNIIKDRIKIGKPVTNNPTKLKQKFSHGLNIITNQRNMFTAIEEGNLKNFKKYLRKGSDIHSRDVNFWTAVHFGAKGTSIEVLKFILSHNLSHNVKDINGLSPLHIAAMYGAEDIIEFFIKEAKSLVDDVNSSGRSPLHIAAQKGHKETVQILLNYKANPNIHDAVGFAPLHYSIKNNHIDIVTLLLNIEEHVDVNEVVGGYTSLHIAAEDGFLEAVKFLIGNGANVNARNDKEGTPLHTTALNGHLEVVKFLISKGADVNARVLGGCTPLHYAVETNQEEVSNLLLQFGANVNSADETYRYTPLHYAAQNGNERIAKNLLNNKANIKAMSVSGMTPLHFAAKGGHLQLVATFLDHGVKVNIKGAFDVTPLHCAAESGCKDTVNLLIKHFADVNAKMMNGHTPLHLAAMGGYKLIVELLIKNKARTNIQDSNGLTALHLCTLNDSQDVIESLIQNSANVNAKDLRGHTPLHEAALNGNENILCLMINNKGDLHCKSNLGMTPLHLAALSGHKNVVDFLINRNAEVNADDNCGFKPLHAAISGSHKDIINLLIKNKAAVNTRSTDVISPLHLAVQVGDKEIIEVLLVNGADIDAKDKCSKIPLYYAVKKNSVEIVKILIANGANVNEDGNESLMIAVSSGYRSIVEIFLNNNARINFKNTENMTPLHLAARRGFKDIVKSLVVKGVDIDALTVDGVTALCLAAEEGHKEIIEILIANGANVNFKSSKGITAFHMAAINNHSNVVQVLLDNETDIHVRDHQNRTALELAVGNGHIEIVKLLLKYNKEDINHKRNDSWTLLHVASQSSNLKMIKYLVKKGSDINVKDATGSKPIHIAAREGCRDSVEFFLSVGVDINDQGMDNQSLLHYAVKKDSLEVLKYLIAQNIDINAKDCNGQTPLHIAVNCDKRNAFEVLLKNGAIYDAVDKLHRRPIDMTRDNNITNVLSSIEKLFEAVKNNNISGIKILVQGKNFILNARSDISGSSILHYAVEKGYNEIVNVLLKNKANVNLGDHKGFTPLHYAAKFSNVRIVTDLLCNGAIYNVVSKSRETPLDLATNKSIIGLLKLVIESFKLVKSNNCKVINNLHKIKNEDILRAVMSAQDMKNKTIVVAAIHNNFSEVKQLKNVSQGDAQDMSLASILFNKGNYKKALTIFKSVFESRKKILGPDNPGTLDMQVSIAKALYKLGVYQEALDMLKEVYDKQESILGQEEQDTLSTRGFIALILHRQGNDKEAFDIYQIICKKQKDLLGPDHIDTLDSQFHFALVLDRLGKHEEALDINRTVFEKRKNALGEYNQTTISVENNIAMVLTNQGKHEEALNIYKDVLKKKKLVLGINHSDTLRTMDSIAKIFLLKNNYNEALKASQEIFSIRKKLLGPNHPETLISQHGVLNVLFVQGKFIGVLNILKECSDKILSVFGPFHPMVLDIEKIMKAINLKFKIEGSSAIEVLYNLQNGINLAATEGDIQTVQRLLKNGVNANDKDIEGRTPLHYASSNGHLNIVKILLKNGSDVTLATNKGNTPLHSAVSKSYKDIIEIILQHTEQNKLNSFINAKTTTGGTTSLHVAAKNGSLEIVKTLLKYGAIYNVQNKEGRTPINLSREWEVTNFLQLVENQFEYARKGDVQIVQKLEEIDPNEFLSLTNARDSQGNTLLQVIILNKHQNIARQLLRLLKQSNKKM